MREISMLARGLGILLYNLRDDSIHMNVNSKDIDERLRKNRFYSRISSDACGFVRHTKLESKHHDYLPVAISPMQWHIGRREAGCNLLQHPALGLTLRTQLKLLRLTAFKTVYTLYCSSIGTDWLNTAPNGPIHCLQPYKTFTPLLLSLH